MAQDQQATPPNIDLSPNNVAPPIEAAPQGYPAWPVPLKALPPRPKNDVPVTAPRASPQYKVPPAAMYTLSAEGNAIPRAPPSYYSCVDSSSALEQQCNSCNASEHSQKDAGVHAHRFLTESQPRNSCLFQDVISRRRRPQLENNTSGLYSQ